MKPKSDEEVFLYLNCVFSRSMSPNLLNRASPLAFNVATSNSGADCPDPFANGADIQVSNIDYRLSRKELQQLIQEAFSRHGKVPFILVLLLSPFGGVSRLEN
jgi:hypothetical protein